MHTRNVAAVAAILLAAAGGAQAHVAKPGDVVINEIAWMGTTSSANSEWLELFNATPDPIDLSGWLLKNASGRLKIQLQGRIPARGFYLLERNSDDTVPSVAADGIYKGRLNNKGDDLTLTSFDNTLVDEVAFTTKWPAGNNTTKQTMERAGALSWQTSLAADGTPKAPNSGTEGGSTSLPAAAPLAGVPPPDATPITHPNGIFINELMPSPQGPDATDEWIELYNNNSIDIPLAGWKLQDQAGTQTTYTFPEDASIPAAGYLVLGRPATGIMLNNGGDGLKLFFPNGDTADEVTYGKAPHNQSYITMAGSWRWSSSPTPGSFNIATATALAAAGPSLQKNQKPDKSKKVTATASLIDAARAGNIPPAGGQNPIPFFLLVAGIAGLGAVAAGVKFFITKHNVRT